MMDWKTIDEEKDVEEIISASQFRPQIIYKHSTQCSLSSMVRSRLEKAVLPAGVDFHYLDLIRYRSVSDKIAHIFNVPHKSPQIILIKDGKPVYDESHTAITTAAILENIER